LSTYDSALWSSTGYRRLTSHWWHRSKYWLHFRRLKSKRGRKPALLGSATVPSVARCLTCLLNQVPDNPYSENQSKPPPEYPFLDYLFFNDSRRLAEVNTSDRPCPAMEGEICVDGYYQDSAPMWSYQYHELKLHDFLSIITTLPRKASMLVSSGNAICFILTIRDLHHQLCCYQSSACLLTTNSLIL
jgi:hypothetical protein